MMRFRVSHDTNYFLWEIIVCAPFLEGILIEIRTIAGSGESLHLLLAFKEVVEFGKPIFIYHIREFWDRASLSLEDPSCITQISR